MSKGISAPFIHRPIATTLLMVAVFLVGIVAFPSLPVAPLPQVDFPTIPSPPAPRGFPETMATSVAQPLERQFAQIPGVSQMTSTSALGATAITVQFDLNRNIDAAANDIQAAINAAAGQLPKDLPSPPTYRKVNPSDTPTSSCPSPRTWRPSSTSTTRPRTFSRSPQPDLGRLPGARRRPAAPAIRIQIDPAKLVEKGMQLEDVRAQIGIATEDSPKGALIGPKQTFTIQDNDQLIDPKAWNDVIVAYRNGAQVRVRDIGQAIAGPQDTTQAAWSNGKRSVFLVVFKIPARTSLRPCRRSRARSPPCRRRSRRPFISPFSRSHDHHPRFGPRRRVHPRDHRRSRGDGDLHIPAQSLGHHHSGVTVPLALLGACALMWAAGYSLDNLSLMAFTISVGFVVDDAIVMLENITRHIEEGEKPFQAALKGSSEIGFTIISIWSRWSRCSFRS